jgi:hypothetical protein
MVRQTFRKPEYRQELLRLMAKTEQLICEWESLTVNPPEGEVQMLASKRIGELRQVLARISLSRRNGRPDKTREIKQSRARAGDVGAGGHGDCHGQRKPTTNGTVRYAAPCRVPALRTVH